MAVKSVLDIDVNDAAFKRFSELFAKYQASLAKSPELWSKAGKESAKAGQSFADIAATMLAMNMLQKEGNEQQKKTNTELDHHSSLWMKIHRSTTGVVKDVASIGKWLARMGVDLGLAGVGVGIVGLFGLMEMSKQVSNERNFALQTGTAIGQQQAFEKFQGRNLSSPDAVLRASMLAQAPGTQEYAAAAGLHISTAGTPYDVANRILLRVRELSKRFSAGQLALMYPGLSNLGLGTGDIEAIKKLPKGELRSDISQGSKWAQAFALSDRQGKQFQDFQSRISSVFHSITTQLERDMVPLLGPITHLVSTFGKDVNLLLSGNMAKRGINMLANALDEFAHYIARGDFTKAIQDFGNDVKDFATAVQHVGFAGGAVVNEFEHPITATQEALDYYNNLSGGWLKYTPPLLMDRFMKHIAGGGTTVSPNVNVHTSHQLTIKNSTGGNVNTSLNQLNGGTQ